MSAVYSIWGITNRIKIEEIKSANIVKESIFWEVYRKADRIFFEIIREMQNFYSNESKWDDQIANVISFLGGRGRGKTSAMLSFYAYLNELQKQEDDCWGEWAKMKDKRVKFVEIPCIDAAALAQNEFLIEVILAKMWDEFDDVMKERSHSSQDTQFEYLVKRVRSGFVNVQKSYTILMEKETNNKEKGKEREVSVASALHEFAASMNFKREFQLLVQDYIRVLNYKQYDRYKEDETGYLVLAIDDIDMAGKKAQSILEQIRRFLSIPQVVVLLTADIERLKNVCESFYKDIYPQDRNRQKFVSEYLEKILPMNQRIYMPELSDNQKEIPIEKRESKIGKLQLKSECEKEMILEFMAQKCNIYFDGLRRKRHFLQNDSLRSLVNYFNTIAEMEDDEYIPWIKNDLNERIVERIEKEEQKQFIKSMLTKDYEDINNFVLNFIKKELLRGGARVNLSDNSIGQVLYACSLLEDENAENIDFVNCILLLYGIMLNQANAELRSKIIGNSIFGEWEYRALTPAPPGREVSVGDLISGFETRAKIEIKISEEVEELIKLGGKDVKSKNAKSKDKCLVDALDKLLENHKNEIMAWLYVMLFVNIKNAETYIFEVGRETKSDDSTKNETDSENKKNEDASSAYYMLKPKVRAFKSFFGCLYRTPKSYADTVNQLWNDAIKALCEQILRDAGREANADEIDKIKTDFDKRNKMKYVNEMKIEEKNTQIELLQGVEIIYGMGKEIGKDNLTDTSDVEGLYEKMTMRYETVRNELHKIDGYYRDCIKVPTSFEDNFMKRIQTKIFLNQDVFSDDVKKAFIERFKLLFRGVITLDKK